MELGLSQRKRLRAAMISAYPKSADLELMVRDELDKALNLITQGQPNYQLVVCDLIDWAKTQHKIPELLIGASRSNPGNQSLQDFITQEFAYLVHDFGPITQELTDRLWQILQQCQGVSQIVKAGIAVLPGGSADAREQANEDLNNDDLSKVVKAYILFRLLLHDYPSVQGEPSILKFAIELSQQDGSNCNTQSLLNDWITAAQKHCGCTVSSPQTAQPTATRTVAPHLMILVAQHKGEQYRLTASLHIYDQAQGSDVVQDLVLLEEIPLDIGSNPAEKGCLCTFDQIPDFLDSLIQCAALKLQNPKRRSMWSYRDMTLEFFLPFDQLGTHADLWERPTLDGSSSPIGVEYRVVLRSCDRILRFDLLLKLEQAWARLKELCRVQSDALAEAVEHVTELDQNWQGFRIRLNDKIGLKMTCPPPQMPQNRDKLFASIVQGNIPLALWTRCSPLAHVEDWTTVLDRFICWDLLSNTSSLLEEVKAERMQAYGAGAERSCQCLGSHLSILLDNPNRIPSVLDNPLSEQTHP